MDITLVYFVYGLAFFSMGLALLLESGRSPLLAEASVLLPLALFGFVHGCHEWLEMFLQKSGWQVLQNAVPFSWLRIFILAISFFLLFVFGLRMLQQQKHFAGKYSAHWMWGLAGYILLVLLIGAFFWLGHPDRMTHLARVIADFREAWNLSWKDRFRRCWHKPEFPGYPWQSFVAQRWPGAAGLVSGTPCRKSRLTPIPSLRLAR